MTIHLSDLGRKIRGGKRGSKCRNIGVERGACSWETRSHTDHKRQQMSRIYTAVSLRLETPINS